MKTISKLFENEPAHWGLGGEPFLWEEMKAKLDPLTMPATRADLEQILDTTFIELTERSWDNRDPIFVARYDHGGMSSGMVCPEFWRETAIPLVVSRYHAQGGGAE